MSSLVVLCLTLTIAAIWFASPGGSPPEQRRLAHIVFFTLQDQSDEACDRLVQACHKYLSGHDGEVHFSAGTRVTELNRPVNDSRFDVALHVVFANKAAHDQYQTHPRHLQFIEENNENWAEVRVFDSFLSP